MFRMHAAGPRASQGSTRASLTAAADRGTGSPLCDSHDRAAARVDTMEAGSTSSSLRVRRDLAGVETSP